MSKKESTRSYGKYWEYAANNKLRAVVQLPLGNGKYKKVRSRLSDNIKTKSDALQWALKKLESGEQSEKVVSCKQLFEWYKASFMVPAVYKDGVKLYGYRNTQPQESRLKTLQSYFGDYKLHRVTIDTILAYKRQRLKVVKMAALNRELSLLKIIFKKAKVRKWLRENPFDDGEELIQTALEVHRKPEITDRIAGRLIARSRKSQSKELYYLLMFLAHTGARPSEAFPLNAHIMNKNGVPIEPVSWDKLLKYNFKMVTLVSFKGRIRIERIVPLPIKLELALRELYNKVKPNDTDYVFTQRSYERAFVWVRESIKQPTVRMRDFRAYYNSSLVKKGFNDMVRMKILGHSHLKTNAIYTQLDLTFVAGFRDTYDVQELDSVN